MCGVVRAIFIETPCSVGHYRLFSSYGVASLSLYNRFFEKLSRFELTGKAVRVAVSGGADSVALLRLMAASERDFELFALHIVHGIRPEGEADAAFVRELCEELGIELELRFLDVPRFAREHGLGIEEAARELRYGVFDEYTRRGEIVATAHTAGDVVETLLFNLARGSGPRGLAGVPRRRGNIIRPLLDFWRKELQEWLKSGGHGWREDESNLDLRFSRNRVRWMMIPEMKRVFGSGVTERLRREADIFAASSEFMDNAAQRLFEEAEITAFGDILVFDSSRALATRWGFGEILRRCFERFGAPLSGFDFGTAMHLHELARTSRKGRRYPVGAGLHIEVDGKLLFVFTELPKPREVALDLPFDGELPGGMGRMTISVEGEGVRIPFDGGPLSLRPARAGDRFDTNRKLRRYLAKKGVPRLLRDVVPLLFSGERPIYSPIIGKLNSEAGLFNLSLRYEGPLSKIEIAKSNHHSRR